MSTESQNQESREELSLERAKQMFQEQAAVGRRMQQSVDVYCNGVDALLRWCNEQGYTTVGDLTKRNVGGFNPWLSSVEEWSAPTKEHYTTGVRQFLHFLEERDEIPPRTHKLVKTHHVPKSDRQSKNQIEIERLDAIIHYMERQYPFHRDTVILKILSDTGMRTCALNSLDVNDVRLDEHNRPELTVRNRPRKGTNLKNGEDHERNVPITRELYDTIKGYVQNHRHEVKDGDRLPLITTRNGRMSKSAIQDTVYKWTCGKHCGLNDCDCDSKPTVDNACQCSMSEGPHAIRGAAITRFRNGGHTWDDISEMAAAEPETLKEAYDYGGFEERADRARSLLDSL